MPFLTVVRFGGMWKKTALISKIKWYLNSFNSTLTVERFFKQTILEACSLSDWGGTMGLCFAFLGLKIAQKGEAEEIKIPKLAMEL